MTTFVIPVSGGKDSQLCLILALEEFNKKDIRVVHQNTGYDHPSTYEHLDWMEQFYGIKIEHTHSNKYKDVFDLIEKTGHFPNSLARSCTSGLKQKPFADWLRNNGLLGPRACMIWMGMRAAEGKDRNRKYGMLEPEDVMTLDGLSGKYGVEFRHVEIQLPIVNLTEQQVFEEIKRRGHKINHLYSIGARRVGCFPCLLASNADWELAAKDETGRAHIKRLLEIEQKFKDEKNPRKLIKIHLTRDVKALYEKNTPCDPTDDKECGWCSI